MDYRGFFIDEDMVLGGYTVQYCGDEIFFDTIDEAKSFIDEVVW